MMNELLELLAAWDRASGQRLTEANRLGPCKAGEVKATEAGILRDCADDLRKVISGFDGGQFSDESDTEPDYRTC